MDRRYTADFDVYSRQILTYKDGLRTERVEHRALSHSEVATNRKGHNINTRQKMVFFKLKKTGDLWTTKANRRTAVGTVTLLRNY